MPELSRETYASAARHSENERVMFGYLLGGRRGWAEKKRW
jgi:hypothetical protein